jgi:hypothetical protein
MNWRVVGETEEMGTTGGNDTEVLEMAASATPRDPASSMTAAVRMSGVSGAGGADSRGMDTGTREEDPFRSQLASERRRRFSLHHTPAA